MNNIFLCGIISDKDKKEDAFNLLIPNNKSDTILEVYMITKDKNIMRKIKRMAPFDLVFVSGLITNGTIMIRDMILLSRFKTKAPAFEKLLELNPINVGLLSGVVKKYDINERLLLISIKRDKGVFYGDIKNEDLVAVKVKEAKNLKPNDIVNVRVAYGGEGIGEEGLIEI